VSDRTGSNAREGAGTSGSASLSVSYSDSSSSSRAIAGGVAAVESWSSADGAVGAIGRGAAFGCGAVVTSIPNVMKIWVGTLRHVSAHVGCAGG
jgi:hypothetical protein